MINAACCIVIALTGILLHNYYYYGGNFTPGLSLLQDDEDVWEQCLMISNVLLGKIAADSHKRYENFIF